MIGATVRTTPELVARRRHRGLVFLDEAERIAARVAKLRQQGVKVQIVVIHEGAALGANAIDGRAGRGVAGTDHAASSRRCRTRRSTS